MISLQKNKYLKRYFADFINYIHYYNSYRTNLQDVFEKIQKNLKKSSFYLFFSVLYRENEWVVG